MPDENRRSNNQPNSSSIGQNNQPVPIDPKSTSPDQSQNSTLFTGPSSQPAAVVNGRPFTPTTPSASQSEQKPSRWRLFFNIIGILQAAGIALFLLVMLLAAQQAKAGVSGTEFIGLIMFMTVVPVVAVLSIINVIGLPLYMRKHKPKGKWLVFRIASLIISAFLVLYGAYSIYSFTTEMNNLTEESRQKFEEKDRQFAAANAKPEITKEEAIELLKTCKLKGFYYTNQTDKSDPANGGWGELSTTGVVLTKVDGQPYRISIADRLISELVPIAREAQKTCVNPQFWHDETYEHYKDGKWYFKGEVVNSTQSGKTKEEAISFMQNCKADYFVGYTDINLVKDSSARSWLDKAEKSTTGIEISEGSPKSYVFVSKEMTTALQDAARQFRQSCYSSKKLYITVDNWIETEYPQGKWTRVNQ